MEKQVILTDQEYESLIDENKRLKGIIDNLKENNSVFEIEYYNYSFFDHEASSIERRKAIIYSNNTDIQKASYTLKKLSDKVSNMSLFYTFLKNDNKDLKQKIEQIKNKNWFERLFNL